MEYFLGEIVLFGFNWAPRGFLSCHGQTLPITQYTALYSLLGNQFGGNGQTEFNLPDLRGKEPVPNAQYCICTEGIYPSRP